MVCTREHVTHWTFSTFCHLALHSSRLSPPDTMRRADIEEGDAAQPLLPESLDDEEEGRQPSWWEPQNVRLPDSPALSAFANAKESAPGTPNGSRGMESGRQSPRTMASGATRKSGKGGTRESRARQACQTCFNDIVSTSATEASTCLNRAYILDQWLQENAMASHKCPRHQDILHIRQAGSDTGASLS